MHADVSAAAADVALEGSLLGAVQDVARGAHEDDGVEALEILVAELRRILRRVDDEAAGRAERADRRDAVGDRGVTKARRAREDEDPRARRRIPDRTVDRYSAGGLLAVDREGHERERDGRSHEVRRRAMA